MRERSCAKLSNATASNFNDPDMLQVGNVGMTETEQLTHFMLWCIASAPLLAGNDIVHASDETLRILTAPELIEDIRATGMGMYLLAAAELGKPLPGRLSKKRILYQYNNPTKKKANRYRPPKTKAGGVR